MSMKVKTSHKDKDPEMKFQISTEDGEILRKTFRILLLLKFKYTTVTQSNVYEGYTPDPDPGKPTPDPKPTQIQSLTDPEPT